MLQRATSKLIQVKNLMSELEYKRINDSTSLSLMALLEVSNAELMPELCLFLKKILNLTECGFFWSDSDGILEDAWCTSSRFLNFNTLMSCANYQNSRTRAWPTFTENVKIGPMCGYLLPFQNQKFYASDHFKETYKPLNVKYLLDLVIHDGERPYGAFLMMRSPESGPFTPDERTFLEKLIPIITSAFQFNTNTAAEYLAKSNTGFAKISMSGEVSFIDTKAANIVWALGFDTAGSFANPNAPQLKAVLYDFIKPYWARVISRDINVLNINNRWGRFNLEFHHHEDSTQIIIYLSKYQPLHTHLINKLHDFKLPPVRQMVAWLLILNHSRQQIALELGVTEQTVTSHIKTIYKETGTQSGHGLLLKLISLDSPVEGVLA